MKPYESFLAQKMEEYITHRLSLGYTIKNIRSNLRHLDRYLKQTAADWSSLQPLFFLTFRESIKGESSMITVIMGEVRRFFQFLVRGGMIEENPLQDIPRPHQETFIPFVFSEKQTESLLRAIREGIRKEPRYFLKDFAVYLAILLQARCGLRISEPLHL